MYTVDDATVEKLSALAEQLPEVERQQLLSLIVSWREDARHAERRPYCEWVDFTSDRGAHHGCARDVSADGMLIDTSDTFEVGDHITLKLIFISAPNPLRLKATVVRKTADGIGVHFDNRSSSHMKEMASIIAKMKLLFGE